MIRRPPFTDRELAEWSRLVASLGPSYVHLANEIADARAFEATCEVVMRVGDVPTTCGQLASHLASQTPTKRSFCCVDHARSYAFQGTLVAAIRALEPMNLLQHCWCGDNGVRYLVQDRWYCLCAAHKPPWWSRLGTWAVIFGRKVKEPFRRKPSEAALVNAVVEAKRRGKRKG